MNLSILRKPVVATFVCAFAINFMFWFWVNVIWTGSNGSNLIERIVWSYSYPMGIATGFAAPLFIGLLTAGLVYSFKRVKSGLPSRRTLKFLALSGLAASYLPLSLLGLAGIMYVS